MDYIIFGFMDNFILILGMYFSYLSIEYVLNRYFDRKAFTALTIAVICAGLGNTFSDGTGFLVTLNFEKAGLTVVGCLIGMGIIPIMEKFKSASRQKK